MACARYRIGVTSLGATLTSAHSGALTVTLQERQFDRLSKTNTVETLLSNLDADALQKCAQIVKACKQCLYGCGDAMHCLRSDYSSASKPTECSMRCATDSRRLQPL